MARLGSVPPKRVIRALEGAGFRHVRTKGSHHVYRRDEPRARVVVPVHSRDVPKGTALAILRDAGLSADDL